MNIIEETRLIKGRAKKAFGRSLLYVAAYFPNRFLILHGRRLVGIQMSADEILAVVRELRYKCKANFLIFGTGKDSDFWARSNRRGKTVFLENDSHWVKEAAKYVPNLDIRLITYPTIRENWEKDVEFPERFNSLIEEDISNAAWDVILVDAPRGSFDGSPGRVASIYLGAKLVSEGSLFVHDCNRMIEREVCDRLLPTNELLAVIGRLRHYRRTVDSEKREAAS